MTINQSVATPSRSQNINLRVNPKQRDLIDLAARTVGKTRTDFILDTVTKEAQNLLLDQRVFLLNNTQWKSFQEALDAPIEVNEKLRKLMTTKSPWES